MKLGVVGSRGFTDYGLMCRTLDEIGPTVIVSGGARGADKLAERYALDRGLECIVFRPQVDMFETFRDAAFARNGEIVEASDEVVAFWDGSSTGTANTIDQARAAGKPLRIIGTTPSLFGGE